MFLAKIKDSFIFGGSPNKSHWYLVYTRKNKVLYLKETTHLYLPDAKRMKQVKFGKLKKVKLTSFEVPSGVSDNKIKVNVFGKKIIYKDVLSNSEGIRKHVRCKYLK